MQRKLTELPGLKQYIDFSDDFLRKNGITVNSTPSQDADNATEKNNGDNPLADPLNPNNSASSTASSKSDSSNQTPYKSPNTISKIGRAIASPFIGTGKILRGVGVNLFLRPFGGLNWFGKEAAIDALKVQLAVAKTITGLVWLPIKFIGQATFGFVKNVTSAVVGGIGGIGSTITGLIEREEKFDFLKAQTLKAVTGIAKLGQSLIFNRVTGLIAAPIQSLWKNTVGSGGKGFVSDTKQMYSEWKNKTPMTNSLKDAIITSENKLTKPKPDSLEAGWKSGVFNLNSTINNGFDAVKNFFGSGLASMRKFFIGNPEQKMQQLYRQTDQEVGNKISELMTGNSEKNTNEAGSNSNTISTTAEQTSFSPNHTDNSSNPVSNASDTSTPKSNDENTDSKQIPSNTPAHQPTVKKNSDDQKIATSTQSEHADPKMRTVFPSTFFGNINRKNAQTSSAQENKEKEETPASRTSNQL